MSNLEYLFLRWTKRTFPSIFDKKSPLFLWEERRSHFRKIHPFFAKKDSIWQDLQFN